MSADCSKLDQDQANCPQILGLLPTTFSAKLCLVSFSAAGADADTAQRHTHRVATAVRTPLLNMSSPDKGLCQRVTRVWDPAGAVQQRRHLVRLRIGTTTDT